MSKPIIVEAWKYKESALVEEEWTYEKILSIWDKNSLELTPQLVHRCQKYEEQLEQIAKAWNDYKEYLITKYPATVGHTDHIKEKWQFTCPYHKTMDKLCKEEL